MNKLELISCNSDGVIKFKINNHIITSNINRIFKWESPTVDKTDDELCKIISSGIYYYKNLINSYKNKRFKC